MKFQEQLAAQTQNYPSPNTDSAKTRNYFGSGQMTKSVIFPSKTQQPKIEFGKRNGGLKAQNTINMKGSFVFKNEKLKSAQSGLVSGNMFASMIVSKPTGPPRFSFEDYISNKAGQQANYPKNPIQASKPSEIDEIINRHKSASYSPASQPLSNPYLNPPTATTATNVTETYKKPYTQTTVGGSSSSKNDVSKDVNVKSSLVFENYTVDDFKRRDNLYGCFDPYEKISGYKLYDTFYDKYGLSNATSSNYNYLDNTNSNSSNNAYSVGSKYQTIPTSAFTKKSYTDYDTTANNYHTSNEYSNSNKYLTSNNYAHNSYSSSNYAPASNAQKGSNTVSIQSNFKESDFQRGKKLGKGQFGEVYVVRHKLTGFICALKIIPKTVIKEENVEDQLVRQIKIQSYLKHNNLVTLYGFFADYLNVYLLMELCTDGHVFDILKKRRRVEQPQVRSIVRDICVGLDYIHNQRIIHRDIKPENVILQNGVAKLCDFGWSVYRGTGLRSTFCGTPLYTSPQLIRGQKYDQKIDIWAIGILTYELLIGRIPFKIYTEDDLSRILEDKITFPQFVEISYDAKDFILKVLDRSPGGTYLTVDMLLGHPFLKIEKNEFALPDATCI